MGKRKRVQLVQVEVDGEMVDAKECTKCGVMKVLVAFSRDKTGLGGRDSRCKVCSADRVRKWREENRDYVRKYLEENREWKVEYNRKWHEKNRERRTDYRRKWREENPEKAREIDQRRRARKNGLPDDMTNRRWEEIVSEDFNNACALTGESDDLTMEHFIPLSIHHGGTYDGNLYPMVKSLNSSKWKTNPFEWVQRPDISERIPADRWNALVLYLAEKNGLTVEEFREFVYWCFDNPRTPEQAAKDTKRGITSLDLWRASKLRAASNE